MRQNELLDVVIGPNTNVLSDCKSPHTQGHQRVAHASRNENYTGPLIAFIIRVSPEYAPTQSSVM